MNAYLSKLYYDLDKASAYSGNARELYEAARNDGKPYTLKQIQNFLQKQDAYTLHRNRRIRFPRLKTISSGLHFQHQADLIDLKSLSTYNSSYRYLLCVLDIFSRRASVIPLKSKTQHALTAGLKKLYSKFPLPLYLQVDKGSEFHNLAVKKWLKREHVKLFSTEDYRVLRESCLSRTIPKNFLDFTTSVFYQKQNLSLFGSTA